MSRLKFSSIFPWVYVEPKQLPVSDETRDELPLREFVYLDEVSLSSLLASKKGEQTENVVFETGEEALAEVAGKIEAKTALGANAEIGSRFQTSNSSALQTTRKANAQSLFRELYAIKNLRKFDLSQSVGSSSSITDLIALSNSSTCYDANALKRGDLVEFRVRLSASWIFQMSTIVSEFAEIFDQSPHLFISNIKIADLFAAKDAQKVLSKLLADLIPIEGAASDYGVLSNEGADYIVHKDAVTGTSLKIEPLKIVGVTDHLAYWKDIRRILFADHQFTILCRVSKPGLQSEWNPIKVADIFAQFAPDMARQIEMASKAALANADEPDAGAVLTPSAMALALNRYARELLQECSGSEGALESVAARIDERNFQNGTAIGQREAFAQIREWVEELGECSIDADADLDIRNRVRSDLGLSVFNIDANPEVEQAHTKSVSVDLEKQRLLEVEVVAIYW